MAGSSQAAPGRRRRAVPAGAATDQVAREREILVHIARGFSNAEIAEQLVVSPLTTKTHVARVLDKLNMRDRIPSSRAPLRNRDRHPGQHR